MANSGQLASENKLSDAARRSMLGGIISLLIDSYDIYLPAFVLPGAMDYFEPASMSDSTKVMLTTLIFTITLLARPIGGPILGNLSDKIGRKRVTMIAAYGFTVTTFLIGLIPGYNQWGYGSIGALIFLRLIDGIFLGGGYAGPVPLAIERAPKRLRGLIGGLISAGAPIAIVFINLVNLYGLKTMPHHAFLTWGWRIPFFFGAVLGIFYIIYYSRIPELKIFEESGESQQKTEKQPIWQLFAGENRRGFIQLLLLMSGMWFAAQMALSFMPGLLIEVLHQSPSNISTFELIVNVATAAGMIIFAVISQKIGRRRFLIWAGLLITVGTSLAFYFMIQFAKSGTGFFPIGLMAFFAFFLTNAPLGTVIVYLNERFPTNVRGAGYGTVYTISLILPGLYSTWLYLLGKIMPYNYTALVLIVFGGLLFTIAAFIGPETRNQDLFSEAKDSNLSAS